MHLFKKTYIQIDSFIDAGNDRIVISNKFGVKDPYKASAGKVYFQVKNLIDLVGRDVSFNNLLHFFEFLSSENDTTDRPIVIYLDQDAFTKVVAAWFKIIFAEISAPDAWNLVKSFYIRSKLLGGTSVTDFITYQNAEIKYVDFEREFNAYEIDEPRAKQFAIDNATKLSLEYLLSSYAYDGSFKPELKKAVKYMMNRQFEQAIIETKYTIYRKIMKQSLKSKLGLQDYTLDNLETIVSDPVIKLLVDSSFCHFEGVSTIGKNSAIDLKNISDADITSLDDLMNDVYPELEYKEYFVDYLKYIRKADLTDAELKKILNNETTTDEPFWSTVDLENINIYFVEYVLQNLDNKDILKPYVIRT